MEPNAYSKPNPGKIECLPYTNRLTKGAIESYFPALFELAKRCQADEPSSFDFVLLACLKGSYQGDLLFYVRHFPHLFSDLSFMGVNEQKLIHDFNTVIDRLVDLENQGSYKILKRISWRKAVYLNLAAKPSLKSPTLLPLKGESRLSVRKGKWTKKPFKSFCQLLFIKKPSRK